MVVQVFVAELRVLHVLANLQQRLLLEHVMPLLIHNVLEKLVAQVVQWSAVKAQVFVN